MNSEVAVVELKNSEVETKAGVAGEVGAAALVALADDYTD